MLEQLVSFLFQEPLLSLLLGGYFFLTFGDAKERRMYFDRTFKILIAPTKLEPYQGAPDALNRAEGIFGSILLKPYVEKALESLTKTVSENFKPNWKKGTGWLFLAIMLIGFLIADLITIEQIAELLGFPIQVAFLENFSFGFAITLGTFFSVITAGFVYIEVSATNSEFSNFSSEFYNPFRLWMQRLSIFTIVSSLLVVAFFGLQAFATTFTIPDNIANYITGFANFSGNFLVRINTFIITLLIFVEALNGFQSIFFALILLIIVFLAIANFLTEILKTVFRLLLDLIYRTFLWIIWSLSFWIAKPLDKLTWPIRYLWNKFFGGPPSPPPASSGES